MFSLPCLCFMVQHKWLMVVAIVFLYAYDAAYLYPPLLNIFVVLYGHIVTATQSLCTSLSVL